MEIENNLHWQLDVNFHEDPQSEAIVKIRVDGSNEVVTGRGVSVDVMEASIKAYINGINKYFND